MHKLVSRVLVFCLILALMIPSIPAFAGTFPTDDEPYSILVLGIDYREEEGYQVDSSRSDTIMIVTINKSEKTIHLTSVLRDLYVSIPGYGSNRINTAYSFGGVTLLEETIEANFGVEVDGYVVIDFDLVMHVVDALGGIELTLTEAEAKEIKNHLPSFDLEAGTHTLNGEQALMYCRIRKGVGDDFARTERQREVMRLVFSKASSISLMGMLSLVSALDTIVESSVEPLEYIKWAALLVQLRDADVSEMRVPFEGAYSNQKVNGMSVLVPNIAKNSAALKEYMGLDKRTDAEQVTSVLKKGNEGDDVRRMQEALLAKGYEVEVNGIFDDATEEAIKRFQASCNLKADGVAGPKTLESLYA